MDPGEHGPMWKLIGLALLAPTFVRANLPASFVIQTETPATEASEAESPSKEQRAAIADRGNAWLARQVEEHQAPGASAALVFPDGSCLPLVAGFADREEQLEMVEDVRLLQGSVGKTYFSAAALLLHAEDKLDLDSKVAPFFEGQAWYERLANHDTITVRQLMRHQSGLPRYVFQPGFFAACLAKPDRTWSIEERMSFVFDQPASFAAGGGWGYSDTNYILLGAIIESLVEGSAYEFIEKRLLGPLKLADTTPSDRRDLDAMAQGYADISQRFGFPARVLEGGRFLFNPQFEWAGGGYASNASDLGRWAFHLYRGEAFEGSYLELLLDSVPAALGPETEYGLGVMCRESELGPQIGHDGFDPGFTATMAYFPDQEMAVALMVNSDRGFGQSRPLHRAAADLVSLALQVTNPDGETNRESDR